MSRSIDHKKNITFPSRSEVLSRNLRDIHECTYVFIMFRGSIITKGEQKTKTKRTHCKEA